MASTNGERHRAMSSQWCQKSVLADTMPDLRRTSGDASVRRRRRWNRSNDRPNVCAGGRRIDRRFVDSGADRCVFANLVDGERPQQTVPHRKTVGCASDACQSARSSATLPYLPDVGFSLRKHL